jgi:hypothetical protein
MKKLLARLGVIAAMVPAAIVASSAPASAATCYSGGGSTKDFTIIRCGADVSWTFNHSSVYGHAELWNYNNTSQWANTTPDANHGAGWGDSSVVYPWGSNRTCIEYWYLSGSTWKRLDGQSICTSA